MKNKPTDKENREKYPNAPYNCYYSSLDIITNYNKIGELADSQLVSTPPFVYLLITARANSHHSLRSWRIIHNPFLSEIM